MIERSSQNGNYAADDYSAISGTKSSQIAYGDYSAVAGPYGTAIVNVYRQAQPRQIAPDEIEKAKKLLDSMPLDVIADVAGLPTGSRMPFDTNPLFVGRKGVIERIARILKEHKTVAVTGLGGIGKTQLAIEFVHRYGKYFAGGVFWLSFADPNAISSEVAACGGIPGFELRSDYHTLPTSDQVRLVSAAWQSSLPRLLVFDNCEDESLLTQWRPSTGASRVLLTSRRAVWTIALKVKPLALGVLVREESISLLQKHRPDLQADEADLAAIAEELGDLPLALHLAGGFLTKYHQLVTPRAYLKQLRDQALLKHQSLIGRGTSLSPTDHELHIARTFALSYDRLDAEDPTDNLARAILTRVAYFAPGEPIPRQLIRQSLDVADTGFESQLQVEDAVLRLIELGLVEEGIDSSLRQHRLLTAFTRALSHDEEQAQVAVGNTMLSVFGRSNQTGNLIEVRTLEPHLRAVTESALKRNDSQAVSLSNMLGNHLRLSANYSEARFYLEAGLAIQEALLGKDDPGTAISLNDLGLVMSRLGQYEDGQRYLERALRLFKKIGDLPNAAASLDNLGQLSTATGDHKNAISYLKQALDVRQNILGPDHPRTAVSFHSLGDLLVTMGRFEKAKESYSRALTIREKALGQYDRATANSLFSIGLLFEHQGKFKEAADYCTRAVDIYEKVLGPDDPITSSYLPGLIRPLILGGMVKRAGPYIERLKTYLDEHDVDSLGEVLLNNIGLTLWLWGDYKESLKYYKKAMAFQVGVSGTIIFNNIAMVLVPLEKYQLARKYYGRALQIQKQKKHGDRLLTAKILTNYGVLLRILGKLKRAQEHFEQALKIRQEMLGLDHRDTAHTLNNLGLLFRERGDFDLAQRYIEQALATVKKLFSDEHPDIALIYNDFGSLLHIKGKLTGARKYLVKALRMRELTVPKHHPHLAETFTNLGKVNLALGDKTKAAKCFERALPIYLLRFGSSHSLTRDVYAQLASMAEGSPKNGDRKENNRFKPVTG